MIVRAISSVSFGAKTQITVPENLVSKSDTEVYKRIGAKLGKPSDTITVSIGDYRKDINNPEALLYDVYSKASLDGFVCEWKLTVNGNDLTPKAYLDRLFGRWTGGDKRN